MLMKMVLLKMLSLIFAMVMLIVILAMMSRIVSIMLMTIMLAIVMKLSVAIEGIVFVLVVVVLIMLMLMMPASGDYVDDLGEYRVDNDDVEGGGAKLSPAWSPPRPSNAVTINMIMNVAGQSHQDHHQHQNNYRQTHR